MILLRYPKFVARCPLAKFRPLPLLALPFSRTAGGRARPLLRFPKFVSRCSLVEFRPLPLAIARFFRHRRRSHGSPLRYASVFCTDLTIISHFLLVCKTFFGKNRKFRGKIFSRLWVRSILSFLPVRNFGRAARRVPRSGRFRRGRQSPNGPCSCGTRGNICTRP